ncbi:MULTISPECIES: hypothetical protein [Ralstonia solanacearum species complex]|uniref:hypothetical protein n=1 Tax=Ralstonia solanacearum species complex TaxID=3116862 RepID=UPI001FFAAFE1
MSAARCRQVAVAGPRAVTQAMSDPPDQPRVAVLTPVARLSALLRTAPRQGWTVAHVYDN